ncbi:hypothetical protein BDV93DRAFT_510643 [Ceratobasidium sp. AG-I]|nr:hypothetical protein BDV93DRAFT_510643 [Ceratobasidium sp. AG-I]
MRTRNRRAEVQAKTPPPGDNLPDEEENEVDEGEESDGLPNVDASLEQWKAATTQLQLSHASTKRQLADQSSELHDLYAQQGNKRTRTTRPLEATPLDPKYGDAGKRCAIMQMLWVPPGTYDLEPNPSYLPEIRYDDKKPEMRLQGEQQDILASMGSSLRQQFLELEHFQKRFRLGLHKQRHNSASRVCSVACLIFSWPQDEVTGTPDTRMNNPQFKELLGYDPHEANPSERYPALAPMLYKRLQKGSNIRVFRHEYIFKTFSAIAFGEGSLRGNAEMQQHGQPVLAKKLGLRCITPGAIAASAILANRNYRARWTLSPDIEFREQGSKTGVFWLSDYRAYKKLILEGLRKDKLKFERDSTRGPFLRLMSEWNVRFFPDSGETEENGEVDNGGNDDPMDISEALAQIDEFPSDSD